MRFRVGERVLFRPRFSLQWIHGYVLAEQGRRALLEYGVDGFLDRYRAARWVPARRIARERVRLVRERAS